MQRPRQVNVRYNTQVEFSKAGEGGGVGCWDQSQPMQGWSPESTFSKRGGGGQNRVRSKAIVDL